MKYIVVVRIREGRFSRQAVLEKESMEEIKELLDDMPYNWELEKIYEPTKEIKISI